MLSRHGSLEGAILTVLWKLEESGQKYSSVKNVYDNMNSDQRAYTTIKTVMDRLCAKNILSREKIGKKFYYKTVFTNHEIIVNSLNEICQKYCCGNIALLFDVLENMCKSRQLVGV